MSKPLTQAEKQQLLNTTLPTNHENYEAYNIKVGLIKRTMAAFGKDINSPKLNDDFIQLYSYTILGGMYKRKSSKRKSSKRKSMRRRKRR